MRDENTKGAQLYSQLAVPERTESKRFWFFFQCLKSYARKMFFCIFKLFLIILLKNLKQQEEDKFTCSAMKKCENLPHYCCLNFLHICHTHVSGNQANFNIKQGWPEKRQYIVFKWWLHLLGTYMFPCEKVIAPKNNNWLYQLLQLKTAIKHTWQ